MQPRARCRSSVMEQTQLGVHQRDAVLAAGGLDVGVAGGAAGLGDVADAVLLGVVDVRLAEPSSS